MQAVVMEILFVRVMWRDGRVTLIQLTCAEVKTVKTA